MYFVLPPSLKFVLQNESATNVPEFKGRDETKGCNKRDILGETFVSGIPACALRLYPVKAVFAMFTVCNVHCVQFALCAVNPNSAFLTGCSPIPLTPFQLFSGQSSLFTSPAAIGVFVERLTSAQNHITLRCCTKQYLCLVLTCLQSLRRDSNTFHNQLYCQKHIKQNNGLRKYPDRQRGISSTTDQPCQNLVLETR